jgi:hypothetical protein
MDTLTLVLLGVIAAAALAQALSLVAVALAGRSIARRVGAFERSLERDVQPALREAARLTRGLAEVTEVTAGQAQRLADVLDTVAVSVTRTGAVVTESLLPSAVKAANLFSVARAAFELLNLSRLRRSGR